MDENLKELADALGVDIFNLREKLRQHVAGESKTCPLSRCEARVLMDCLEVAGGL